MGCRMRKFLLVTSLLAGGFYAISTVVDVRFVPTVANASDGAPFGTIELTQIPIDDTTSSVGVALSAIAFSVISACEKATGASCTEEAKRAGQNFIDYLRGEKDIIESAKDTSRRVEREISRTGKRAEDEFRRTRDRAKDEIKRGLKKVFG